VRDPGVVRDGIAACRRALAETGVLLVQDATLPSVTTLVTGAPVRGSWWAHEQAHSIFDVLQELEPETTRARLMLRKQTLIDRRLHPELAAVGGERADWQLQALAAAGAALLSDVDAAGRPVRADALTVTGPRGRADVVRDLERRLLVATDEIHTESGRHAKVLQSWCVWAATTAVTAPFPDPRAARATFEQALHRVVDDAGLRRSPFPWPSEDPP
jgi:hypothetical protein